MLPAALLAAASFQQSSAAGPYDYGLPSQELWLEGCRHVPDKRLVELDLEPTGLVSAHELWLAHNRPDWFLWTGQYLKDPDPDNAPVLRSLACDRDTLNVTWDDGGDDAVVEVQYPVAFLHRWLKSTCNSGRQPLAATNLRWAAKQDHDFASVMSSNEALLAVMEEVQELGAAVINDAPIEKHIVQNVTSRMAYTGSMDTLYGSQFSVRSEVSEGPKNNIAYTNVELGLHQDLVYYESMPGLQFLHCTAFDGVGGGQSLLMDVFAVAEELRKQNPAAFKALSEIPVTFIKFDMDRERPAHFEYQTTHFHLHPEAGDVLKVVWSPPFEGPLRISAERVEEYYVARKAFKDLMIRMYATHLLEFTLQPGQVLVFNNGRMLHGRREFWKLDGGQGVRVLEGAYINIDEFRNRLETTRRLVSGSAKGIHESVYIGNRCL